MPQSEIEWPDNVPAPKGCRSWALLVLLLWPVLILWYWMRKCGARDD